MNIVTYFDLLPKDIYEMVKKYRKKTEAGRLSLVLIYNFICAKEMSIEMAIYISKECNILFEKYNINWKMIFEGGLKLGCGDNSDIYIPNSLIVEFINICIGLIRWKDITDINDIFLNCDSDVRLVPHTSRIYAVIINST